MKEKKLNEILSSYHRPLILDGAMGSLIQERGLIQDTPLWSSSVNFSELSVIAEIHREYIKAGCDIITTNTFRTNPLAIRKSELKLSENDAVKISVKISREIADNHGILLAGSNAPAEDCYQKERTLPFAEVEYNHKRHIDLLMENGVDFILNETQSHLDEIEIICKYCSVNSIPYCISLYFDQKLEILSGEKVNEIVNRILFFNPAVILFNCIETTNFLKLLDNIELKFEWGYYLNCGNGRVSDNKIQCGVLPASYAEIVKSSLSLNPRIIGACCGSNPDHIKLISKSLNEKIKY